MTQTIRNLVQSGAERVAVAGGDGTVSLAVQVLVHTKTALGIIPQGTANNFATALRLPLDLPSAIRVIKDGVVRDVDVGKVGERYFTEAAGVGLFADALAIYGAGTNKNLLRGLYAVARLVFSLKAHRILITVDGNQMEERAVMCTASNTFRMGTAMPLAPEAKVTDGELDVVIIGNLRRSELIPYYRALRAQMQSKLDKLTTIRGKEIKIESRRRMNVHCDDRVIGTTPVSIHAEPRALKVLVDRQ
jgi:YegS/Rv2252/BmrU family lipid kinase